MVVKAWKRHEIKHCPNEYEVAFKQVYPFVDAGVLGIPFLDVVRVLAAVLILGNVNFTDGPGVEVGVIGENELASVAALLGVPPPALLRGLTSRTHNARGQLVKSVCDANMVISESLLEFNNVLKLCAE